jgi:hypothetical protein
MNHRIGITPLAKIRRKAETAKKKNRKFEEKRGNVWNLQRKAQLLSSTP